MREKRMVADKGAFAANETKLVRPASSRLTPVAPPAYRPQSTPRVLQTKLRPSQSIDKSNHRSIAPPVYRPQHAPLVLQKKEVPGPKPKESKSALYPVAPPVYNPEPRKFMQPKSAPHAHATKPPMAPPKYRAQSVPKVLQTKVARISRSESLAGPSIHQQAARPGQRRHVHANNLQNRSIQLAERKAFPKEVLTQVTIASGEHRRHIIPNSLMKDAINNWNRISHQWSKSEAQGYLNELNAYIPNLIAGSGVENMSSGGIMHTGHQLEQRYFGSGASSSTTPPSTLAMDISSQFQKVSAFGGTSMARSLTAEVTPVLGTFSTAEEMGEFVSDIGHTGGFDWPTPTEGTPTELYLTWLSVYNGFVSMRDHPDQWSLDGVLTLFHRFLTLPAPATHH